MHKKLTSCFLKKQEVNKEEKRRKRELSARAKP